MRREDMAQVLALYAGARAFMADHGNAAQWGDRYPPQSRIESDLAREIGYVCEADQGELAAAFSFAVDEEPTYRQIFEGAWLSDAPYGVVHRLAVRTGQRGTATFCLAWCFARCGNLRVDTHRNNGPMQGALRKNGYRRCGVIYLKDGAERIAFQKIQ